MKKSRKLMLGLVVVALLLAVCVVALTADRDSGLTDEQIRTSLRCNRATADYTITDYYCNNLQDYRNDLKNDDLLENDWSYEFGQQELQRRGYRN